MGITVLSPHNGEPVKVRDQDVGRAVKDREGRIFYVLEKSDGTGYYGAMTRAGGDREEQRALKLEARTLEVEGHKHDVLDGAPNARVHDATGKKRSGGVGRTAFLAIVLATALVLAWVAYGYWQSGTLPTIPLINEPAPLEESIDGDGDAAPDPAEAPSSSNAPSQKLVPGVRLPYPERGLISLTPETGLRHDLRLLAPEIPLALPSAVAA